MSERENRGIECRIRSSVFFGNLNEFLGNLVFNFGANPIYRLFSLG